ncbi:hypothetical protein AX279_17290 [Pseudomonas sp. J237]|nr:hypothetical protein AX279_17290 [Pseudomonas sp. J237]
MPPELAITQQVPTRLKKGTGLNRLGAGIDVFYIASPGSSSVIGKLEITERSELVLVASEDVSGEKHIAQWLIHEAPADTPWMIGVIGNANPINSLKLSYPPALCRFCGANSGFDFDLSAVRQAVSIIGDLDWKKDIAPALHVYQARMHANDTGDQDKAEKEGKKLLKMFEKNPHLRTALLALCRLPLKPNSGEYEVLSWYNRVR